MRASNGLVQCETGSRPRLSGLGLTVKRLIHKALKVVLVCLACLGGFVSATLSYAEQATTAELTWDAAVAQALLNHPSMEIVRKAEESAERALARAAAAYAPQLNVSTRPFATGRRETKSVLTDYTEGSVVVSTGITTPVGAAASAELAQTWSYVKADPNTGVTLRASARLDSEGRIYTNTRLALEKARNATRKASWEGSAQARNVALATLSTFWHLELDGQRLAILEESARELAQNYNRSVIRHESGLLGATDVLGAKIEWFQAQATLEKAKAEYQSKQAAFAADLKLDLPLRIVPSGGAREEELAHSLDKEALELIARDLDLAVRKRQLDVMQGRLELQQARAGLVPGVSVSGSYSVPDIEAWNNNRDEHLWSVFLNVDIPVFDGGRRRLTLHDKEADLDSLEAAVERDRDSAAVALRKKLVDWDQARRFLDMARLKLEKARLEESLRQQQHEVGIATASLYAEAQRNTRLAAIDLQAALNAQRLVEMEIASITGGEITAFGKPLLP